MGLPLTYIAYPWAAHVSPMGLQRWPMGHPWFTHVGIYSGPMGHSPMSRPWVSHGLLVVDNGLPMEILWASHGYPMEHP